MSDLPTNAGRSRRHFLRLLGLAVPAAGILAACGSAALGGTPSSSPASAGGSLGAAPGSAAAGANGAGTLGASSRTNTASPANAAAGAPSSSTGAASGGGAASCVLAPEQEVGPYYIDGEQIRQDVTDGQAGIPLRLRIQIVNATACAPLPSAAVDIWHANASGDYSGFGNAASNRTFLRGTQVTDASGAVEFTTIYPGWYQGRAVHIHLRVHVGGQAAATYTGGHIAHTGQLFFPDDTSTQVYQLPAYAGHKGSRTMNSQDQIYNGQQGSKFQLQLTPLQPGSIAGGFSTTVTLGVDPNATPAAVGAGGGPGGRPPGR